MRYLRYFLFLFFSYYSVLASQKLVVVSTTTMVTDMVAYVGGEEIELLTLMGPGTDPHLYKPTAQDVRKLRLAQVIFYNGLHLEGRMDDLLKSMHTAKKKVIAITCNIPSTQLLYSDDKQTQPDPHIWFDITLWSQCIDTVAKALCEGDPKSEELFLARATQLKNQYTALNNWVLGYISHLSPEKRILVTSHDAYRYFGRAYGFDVVGVQGISTVTEAGLADIVHTIDFIKEKGIKSIFVESSVSTATIDRISKDSGAKIGGELFSDALGSAKETWEDPKTGVVYPLNTYEGVFRYNISTIVDALL